MKNLSLQSKVYGMLGLIFVVLLVAFANVMRIMEVAENDADIIDVLGRQRMLSQAMGKSALGYAMAKSEFKLLEKKIASMDEYITKMRATYTSMVVGPSQEAGLQVSMNPHQETGPAIPFPATFTRNVNEQFANFQIDILAESPVNPNKGFQDDTDRKAGKFLSQDPQAIFMEPAENNGELFVRFYTADIATVQACATCHAAIKGTPFEVGDMLGIRRFDIPFSKDIALGRAELNPSLGEYNTAKTIFSQTLTAMKSGGEYPVDLAMSKARSSTGIKDEASLAKIVEIEGVFAQLTKTVQILLEEEVGSEPYRQARSNILIQSNVLRKLSNDLVQLYTAIANKNQENIKYTLMFSGVIITLVILMGLLGARSLMKQIGGEPSFIAEVADQVAQGNTDLEFKSTGREATGIYHALQKMVEALNMKAELAQEIAKGNLDVQVSLASRQDILGIALQQMLQSLKEKVGLAQEIAEGNLSVEASLVSTQDTLGQAQQTMMDSLNEVLHQVAASANQLNSGAEQLSSASLTISNGATNQASALEEISASMEQMGAQTRSNADNATQANQLASVARQQAEDGNALMKRMVQSMQEINESSKDISKIIKTIEVIAFQTNVLAINAAVEAARAGVHGKGFAVVAEEVRNLAQNSAEAVRETAANINESIKKVEAGAEIADETAVSLKKIVEGSVQVTDLVSEIATASNEQARGILGINDGLSQLNQITQQNAQISEEASSASEELTGQAQNLKQLVARFKLRRQIFGMEPQLTPPDQLTEDLYTSFHFHK